MPYIGNFKTPSIVYFLQVTHTFDCFWKHYAMIFLKLIDRQTNFCPDWALKITYLR